MAENTVTFEDKAGAKQEVPLGLEHWKEAKQKNVTLRALLNQKFPTANANHDTFTQMCASAGLVLKPNAAFGIQSTSMRDILEDLAPSAAEFSHTNPVQSRVLFPAFMLQYVEDKMSVDRSSAVSAFESMVALTTSVPQYRAEQPVISYGQAHGPEATRSVKRTELVAPPSMLTITAAERQLTIPEMVLGIEISDRAMAATTLDLVGMALNRQREVEGYARVGEDLLALLQGDADIATMTGALTAITANSLSTATLAAGELDDEAWVNYLYKDLNKCRVSHVITDLKTARLITNRTGRPTQDKDKSTDDRIQTTSSIFYPNLIDNVQVYVAPPEWSWPAATIMGIDRDYAIQRYRSVAASYSDVERFVLRRGTGFVISHGDIMTRIFDDAFKVMTLS